MAELRFVGVSKRFGPTQAVDDLNLTIEDGEFVVLLGPTGAGKTTTLRLAAGLERPETGQLFIDGHDVTSMAIADRDVAFIFQQYSLYPHLTVYDNLAFPLRSPRQRWRRDAIARRVQDIAALLRIDHKLANKATQLSGGEMQRVAIGRALVRSPKVFLMDEPLSSLDAKLREELRLELKRIQTELGATVLYVTHDQVEAMTLGDRIGVLEAGHLIQVDSPRTLYTRPHSTYVAQRLGAPPINLLEPALLELPSPARASRAGVRPEDLLLAAGDNGTSPVARVLQIEHLGADTIALLEIRDSRGSHQSLHALLDDVPPFGVGDAVSLAVRRGAVLYFDPRGQLIET
ncbi:MAG: ABC transporter ATP-binding protein [Candidatus Competibacterales bacterium]